MAHFGSIFPIFWAKKIFLENPALSRTTSYGFLAPCQNLEKVNGTIQRKRLGGGGGGGAGAGVFSDSKIYLKVNL